MIKIRNRLAASLMAVLAGSLLGTGAVAQDKLRISLDTNPSHVRNKGVDIFVAELKKRIGNQLDVEVFPSAQLFRDRDVPKALRQGGLEMAVPGTWQLDGVEPAAGIQTLPMFYGVPGNVVHAAMDGKMGDLINGRLEERMRVKIIGAWFDLGGQNFFTIKKPISAYEDIKGMKMRHPGGTANAGRMTGLGATPMLVPFPDVPMAMSQGVIDGVATTYESAWTSKLHDSGLKYAFEDTQFFGQYVPMVSEAFWSKQPKPIQEAILASWKIAAAGQRELAAAAQSAARENLIKAGVQIVVPKATDIVAARKLLMKTQPDLVDKMKIDPKLVESVLSGLKAQQVQY